MAAYRDAAMNVNMNMVTTAAASAPSSPSTGLPSSFFLPPRPSSEPPAPVGSTTSPAPSSRAGEPARTAAIDHQGTYVMMDPWRDPISGSRGFNSLADGLMVGPPLTDPEMIARRDAVIESFRQRARVAELEEQRRQADLDRARAAFEERQEAERAAAILLSMQGGHEDEHEDSDTSSIGAELPEEVVVVRRPSSRQLTPDRSVVPGSRSAPQGTRWMKEAWDKVRDHIWARDDYLASIGWHVDDSDDPDELYQRHLRSQRRRRPAAKQAATRPPTAKKAAARPPRPVSQPTRRSTRRARTATASPPLPAPASPSTSDANTTAAVDATSANATVDGRPVTTEPSRQDAGISASGRPKRAAKPSKRKVEAMAAIKEEEEGRASKRPKTGAADSATPEPPARKSLIVVLKLPTKRDIKGKRKAEELVSAGGDEGDQGEHDATKTRRAKRVKKETATSSAATTSATAPATRRSARLRDATPVAAGTEAGSSVAGAASAEGAGRPPKRARTVASRVAGSTTAGAAAGPADNAALGPAAAVTSSAAAPPTRAANTTTATTTENGQSAAWRRLANGRVVPSYVCNASSANNRLAIVDVERGELQTTPCAMALAARITEPTYKLPASERCSYCRARNYRSHQCDPTRAPARRAPRGGQ